MAGIPPVHGTTLAEGSALEDRYHPTGLDAYRPAEIARRVQDAGVAKAELGLLPLAVLATLAGVLSASAHCSI